MRRNITPRSTGFFSGRELLRVLSLVFMLAVIGVTIFRFRASNEAVKLAESGPIAKSAENAPAAPGPTDGKADPGDGNADPGEAVLDSDNPAERAAFENEAQAVMDLATAIHPVEMPAYTRLLHWADHLDASSNAGAADITFHDLVKKPNQNRARLMHVKLRVRRVQSYPLPSDDPGDARTVYELWGWPVAADGWLYVVVTSDLPAGFPTSGQIDETVDVDGYFFKLQGYHPAESKPNAKPLAAPLVIGRVNWVPAVALRQQRPVSPVALTALGMVLVSLAGYWFWPRKKRSLQEIAATPDQMPEGFEAFDEAVSPADDDNEFSEEEADESSYEPPESAFDRRRADHFD